MSKKIVKLLTLGLVLMILTTVFSVFLIARTNKIHYQGAEVTPPRNLSGKAYEDYTNIVWDTPAQGSDKVTGYQIYRSMNKDDPKIYDSVSEVQLKYADMDVEIGTTYYYWVTAVYGPDEETDYSNRLELSVNEIYSPTKPRNLEARPGDEKVELTWDKPIDDGGTEIMSYEIYRGNESNNETYFYDTDGKITSYIDYNVTNGQTYYYKVKAHNGMDESPFSSEVSAKPRSNLSTPDAPQDLQIFVGNETIELNWKEPEDNGGSPIIKYKVYREVFVENGPNSKKTVRSTEGNETYFIDNSFTHDDDYIYQVSAINIGGEGRKSAEVKAETVSQGFPPTPNNLTADVGDGVINLNWKVSQYLDGTVDSYKIYRDQGKTPDDLKYYKTVTEGTNFSDKDVENDKYYYYTVKAVSDDDLLSSESPIVSARPLETKDQEDDNSISNDRGKMLLPWLIIAVIIIIGIIFIAWKQNQDEPKGPQQPPSHEWQGTSQQNISSKPPKNEGTNQSLPDIREEDIEDTGAETDKENDPWNI